MQQQSNHLPDAMQAPTESEPLHGLHSTVQAANDSKPLQLQ